MTISYPNVEAEIPIIASPGTHINVAQYLSQLFAGGGYSTYWLYNDDNFDATRGFWTPSAPQHSFFTLNGVSQPEGFFNVSPAQLNNVEIVVGSEICSRMLVQVNTGTGPGPGDATWTQFWIDVIPAVYTDPTPQLVNGSDVVAAARAFGAHFAGASSPEGCHDIAMAFAAAAGAPLPIDSGSLVPSENQDGGLWTVVHRGDVNPNPHWQSSLQSGDIVRFDYADPNQPQHTFTVLSVSAAGVETLDNFGGVLNFHTTNFESLANPTTVTVYRITSPLHVLDGAASNDFLSGSTLNDKLVGLSGDDVLNGGSGDDTLIGGPGNDSFNGGPGDDTAVFTQTLANYSVQNNGTNIAVSGPDGHDVLLNIEHFRFADVAVNLNAGDEIFTAPSGNSNFDGGVGNDIISFNFKLTDATVSFSGNHVIVDGPSGSHTVLTGVETFVFTDGTVNDNDGDPLVDDLFYYSHNRDVWNAHVDADQHYHQSGWHEARDPNAFFSTSFYLSLNQDVKQAGADPLVQFDQFGWREGRQPSAAFDDAAYLAANPDVAAAHLDPLAHFLQSGQGEGRQPTALTSLIGPHGFDYVFYLQHNPDVQAAEVDPFQHYENFGWKEGRNPNALFDTNGYLAAYPDVANAHINPLDHYDQDGWREGRDPSPAFDTTDYLSHYPDVMAAHIDPLVHYLQFGIHEGRQTFADGIWG
jgi:hypothetical protein